MGEAQEARAAGVALGSGPSVFENRRRGWLPITTHYIVSDVTDLKQMLPGWCRVGDTCSCDIISDRVLLACIGNEDEIDDDISVLTAGGYAWVILSDEQSKIEEHVRMSECVINLTIRRAKT